MTHAPAHTLRLSRSRRPGLPRRARRGLGALATVMLIAGLLATVAVRLQLAMADERVRGHARHLAEAVAAEGYGLHHWLHAERIAGTVPAPARGHGAGAHGRGGRASRRAFRHRGVATVHRRSDQARSAARMGDRASRGHGGRPGRRRRRAPARERRGRAADMGCGAPRAGRHARNCGGWRGGTRGGDRRWLRRDPRPRGSRLALRPHRCRGHAA